MLVLAGVIPTGAGVMVLAGVGIIPITPDSGVRLIGIPIMATTITTTELGATEDITVSLTTEAEEI
jgi:hypothetical protein